MKSKSGSSGAESSGKSPGKPVKSIKGKLYVSFGFLIVIFLLVSAGAIGIQLYFDAAVTNLFNTQIRFSELVKSSETALLEAQVLEREFLAGYRDRGPEGAKAVAEAADNLFQTIHASLRDVQQLPVGQENTDMARDFDKAITEYQKGFTTSIGLIQKRLGPEGLDQQLRSAGQALEDFFRERGMNVSGVQLMRMYEQRYLLGEKKAGEILTDALAQIKNQMEGARVQEGDRETLDKRCSAYGAALEEVKKTESQLQAIIANARAVDSKIRPMLWNFYTAGSREKNIELEKMKKVAQLILLITAICILAFLVIGIFRAIQISRSVTRQVGHIMDIFQKIGVGDYSARTVITANDELGAMAASLNSMLDSIFELIQTREERNTMQASLMKLLDDVSGVADGDLSKEAQVTQDFTGAIADAFNFAIIQLRQIVQQVKDSTLKVSASANDIAAAAERLAVDNEATALRIAQANATMSEMAITSQDVSDSAAQSASVSDQALDAAKQGAQAVLDTINGMNRIRDKVQETAKRIKRLGESSQEIGDIVQMINDIADRTSILAMNASIQAAMSGESGRGFAVVAEEVERLAQRSAKATKQITELVKAIQSETNETVVAMEETTMEVVTGSDLANDAGQALSQIETTSSSMAAIIGSISEAARRQAISSEEAAQLMAEISQATQQAAAGVRQAAVAIGNLAGMADELRGSVNVFKLPDDATPRLNS